MSAAAPTLTPPLRTRLDDSDEAALLQSLDLSALHGVWRKRLRSKPPPHLNRPLMLRLLAYRLQAQAHGDLDTDTIRMLDGVARDGAARRQAGEARPKAVPPVAAVPRDAGLKAGTVLMREHDGVTHRVVVVPGGFAWSGSTYASLSEIARAITGTRWNGPRFFGLRDRTPFRPSAGL